VRFEHEREPYGVFSYIKDALALLPESRQGDLKVLRAWFNECLAAPDLLTIERFWFCAEAKFHIAMARRLADIMSSVGIPIVERRTRRIPGRVKWQDNHQVAVITYRDTPQPRKGRGAT